MNSVWMGCTSGSYLMDHHAALRLLLYGPGLDDDGGRGGGGGGGENQKKEAAAERYCKEQARLSGDSWEEESDEEQKEPTIIDELDDEPFGPEMAAKQKEITEAAKPKRLGWKERAALRLLKAKTS